MTVQVRLDGLVDIRRDLERLEGEIQRKALRSGVGSISTAVKKEAQSKAPVDQGGLRTNITSRFWRSRDKKHQFYAIRVRTKGKRGDPHNAYYWRFVEEGHAVRGGTARTRRERIAFSGQRVPGQEFLSHTFDWLKANIDSLVQRHMRAGIDRTVKRLSRK